MEFIGVVFAVAFLAPGFFLVVHHDVMLQRQERRFHDDQPYWG